MTSRHAAPRRRRSGGRSGRGALIPRRRGPARRPGGGNRRRAPDPRRGRLLRGGGRPGGGFGRRALALAAATLGLCGLVLFAIGMLRQQPAPAQPPVVGPGAQAPQSGNTRNPQPQAGDEVIPPLPGSPPIQVSIPSLGVSSKLEQLGLDDQRAMETPRDPDLAGWFTPGPSPGEVGPSIIAGHVTWDAKPAVFFRLAELGRGDRIEVTREDGRTAAFTVERVGRYPKSRFPTIDVYRNLDYPGLRLITCGGRYSEREQRYADNVVVFARLSDVS